MKEIVKTGLFTKDFKRMVKRGGNLDLFAEIVGLLANEQELPESCRPHKLSGNYAGVWECHIEPDWLLIYEYDDTELKLRRTGTHSDLFR